jgi:hypothetical protein
MIQRDYLSEAYVKRKLAQQTARHEGKIDLLHQGPKLQKLTLLRSWQEKLLFSLFSLISGDLGHDRVCSVLYLTCPYSPRGCIVVAEFQRRKMQQWSVLARAGAAPICFIGLQRPWLQGAWGGRERHGTRLGAIELAATLQQRQRQAEGDAGGGARQQGVTAACAWLLTAACSRERGDAGGSRGN